MLIMVDHVDQVNVNDTMLSANTFCVKEEQCQEDSFIEDKVYISETAITTDNVEIHGSIWHDKIKQSEKYTCSDDIKTELASSEVTEVQNYNVKIEEEISADNKIQFNNRLQYCEHCEAYYEDYCIDCGMLVNILNKNGMNSIDNGAREDIPNDILEIQDCFGQIGIYALRIIPAGVNFGPFTGLSRTECPWKMKGDNFVLDKNKSKYLNWMQYVNSTKNISKRNLNVFQWHDNLYYQSTRPIQAREELLVYFCEEYRKGLNKIVKVDFVNTTKGIVKDVFACTFCCLGLSSKSHLAKHKTICVKDAAGKFSIEELTQCPFCKIHLDQKEYLQHHMAFCCERNSRKGIIPTPPAKQATAALNGRKRCLQQFYKCERCKYRTKNQADLKKHTKQHYEVKMYRCEICNRHFKTKEILRLHMETTHASVGGKNGQERSMTDYRNIQIKVEQSSSQDRKKIFKCSLCMFRAKYKQSLSRHIKTKHLEEFDYKCDKCEFKTNSKSHLKRHIKTIHFKEFTYKCDSCEFRTNNKSHFECHIKAKHLKSFDYKCDSCEYRSSSKHILKVHIKTKHLKKFDYNCDTCEYRTNFKANLKAHITKHLKTFDCRCNYCEFRTNYKIVLERHTRTIHLKEFNYNCDSCEYGTNVKANLEIHIKVKHLKKFAYKCDSCEFGTNTKHNLEVHIKTKHLKKFDFKCDSCEFETNLKYNLKRHIKTKHLKNVVISETHVNIEKAEFRT